MQDVKVNGQHYYYGVMNGTSMATPVVTGIIALWLQANPDLTPADIVRIMQKLVVTTATLAVAIPTSGVPHGVMARLTPTRV